MQQHEYFPGKKNRSNSRRSKANSSDCGHYSGTRHGNNRLSPRFANVPDAPPDPYNPYRYVQERLPDRYRTVQDKLPTDRYRNAQSRSSPDRYRNLRNKPFPDPSRNAPDNPLPGSSRNVPDKSLPDSSRKVPDKSLADSSRKVPDKSLPDSSIKVADKFLPDSSRKVPDKSLSDLFGKVSDESLPDSSRKVLDKSLPDTSRNVHDKSSPYRYRNVPDNKNGDSQHSFKLPSHSSQQEGQSKLGGVTSCEFTSRLGTVKSPVLGSPVLIPRVNVQPLPMTFMLRFPPPHFVPCPPAVTSYQTVGIANDTFCDFNQYPSSLTQPSWDSWENYPEMDRSSFCFNSEVEPFESSYSYWTDSGVEQLPVLTVQSDANLTEYSAAYDDTEYNASFFTEPPLIDCSARHDTAEFHKGYCETNLLAAVQAMQPHYAPMIAAPQAAVVPAPVPRGIVSRSIRSFLPHFMQPKTPPCQSEKHLLDASTNTQTQTSGTYISAGTNTVSGSTTSIGTNTEAAELIGVSTNTDQVELRTIATNTELFDVNKKEMKSVATNTALSGVMSTNEMRMAVNSVLFDAMPTRATTDPSEVLHQSESGTNFGGAKPKRRLDSTKYTYCRSNEDEIVDHTHNISRTSSSERASSDVIMSDPECSLRQHNIQKDAYQRQENSCAAKLHSADLEGMSKAKRNMASKSDLDEIYYSDESSASDKDEMVKESRVPSVIHQPVIHQPVIHQPVIHQPDDHDRFSVPRSPDFFPKWAATSLSSPLSPASAVVRMPLTPDLTKLRDYSSGNLMGLPHSTNALPGFSLLPNNDNQKFQSAASNDYFVSSSPSDAPSLCPSQPLSPFKPECFPDSAGDASFVHSVLIENPALTRQIMMLLLKVNPMFALDPPAHRLAAFKELMLVKRCQLEMKLLQQRQKVSETGLQRATSWNDPQGSHNNESTFRMTGVKEQQLSRSQLDQCMQQAAFNSSSMPQQQQNLHLLEGWPIQCLEKEHLLLQKQPQEQHVQPGQHKIYIGCNDLQTGDESYSNPDNLKMNRPSEEMEGKPFRQLRHQRRIVGTKEGNAYWRDRFARQKASDWSKSQNISEIKNEELNAEKISELSEITVEDSATKTQCSSDEDTWQKVCRKKKTVRTVLTLKESGPKKFNKRR